MRHRRRQLCKTRIEKLDIFADVKTGDFEAGVADGSIQYIPDEVYTAFVEQVKNQSVLFGEEVNKNVAIVYPSGNAREQVRVMCAFRIMLWRKIGARLQTARSMCWRKSLRRKHFMQ